MYLKPARWKACHQLFVDRRVPFLAQDTLSNTFAHFCATFHDPVLATEQRPSVASRGMSEFRMILKNNQQLRKMCTLWNDYWMLHLKVDRSFTQASTDSCNAIDNLRLSFCKNRGNDFIFKQHGKILVLQIDNYGLFSALQLIGRKFFVNCLKPEQLFVKVYIKTKCDQR